MPVGAPCSNYPNCNCEDCTFPPLSETEAIATNRHINESKVGVYDRSLDVARTCPVPVELFLDEEDFAILKAESQPENSDQYSGILKELDTLHTVKSGGYGTGTDSYANFSAVAALTGQPRYLYATLRAIEKLTRVLSLHEQGRTEELSEEFTDIASLAICAESMRRMDG